MKMKPLFLFLLLSGAVYAQQSEYEAAIKAQYEKQAGYSDMDTQSPEVEKLIIQHTYPPIIELMGGEDQYIQLIRSTPDKDDEAYEDDYDDEYEDEEEGPWSLKESKTELGEIGKVYQSGDELQAVIEIVETDVYGDRDEIYKRYQLAISRDGGEFWYFLDGTMEWDKIVPNLHEAIRKPEEKEETVFK